MLQDIKIIFKPHPAEIDPNSLSYFESLSKRGIIVESHDVDLYHLFARSKWQLGISSTAIYEGIYFGLSTFIYKISTSSYMDKIVNYGLAKYISNVGDIDLNFSLNPKSLDHIFERNSKQKSLELFKFLKNYAEKKHES